MKGDDRIDFTVNLLKWLTTAKQSNPSECFKLDEFIASFHYKFALNLWNEKNYVQARYHFLHSNQGETCAKMLIEYHTRFGFDSEVDLFITQTVLQYLNNRKKETAKVVFETYTQEHPLIATNMPFNQPLLNFVQFLLRVIEQLV